MPDIIAAPILLEAGDKVSIIAPASQFRGADRHLLDAGVEILRSWNLDPIVRVDAGHHFYLAGSDEIRAGHLRDSLMAPDEKAIFCTRGGYGVPRLLQRLQGLVPPPKIIVGYSDITALHLAASRLWPQLELVHGPNIATQQLLGSEPECEVNRQALHRALFVGDRYHQSAIEFLRPGRTSGPLVGGCLSLVASSIGTPFSPLIDNAILFLEDSGEPPYRIDRMVTQLRNAGIFDSVAGVVFGRMHKCSDPYNDLRAVISDLFREAPFPVAFGVSSGHGPLNRSIRLGGMAQLDSDAGDFSAG